jgi:outer membrane protein OmpA-like peptidoglycan-associated protein
MADESKRGESKRGESKRGESKRGIVLPIAVTLVGLAAIGVAEDIPVRHSIQHKLTTNSSDALRRAGVPFSNVHFVGRDGTVTVPSTTAGARAITIVQHVQGVRVVNVVVLGQLGNGGTPITASPTPSVSLTAVPSTGPSSSPAAAGPGSAPSPSDGATGAAPSDPPSSPAATTPSRSSSPSPSAAGSASPKPKPSSTPAPSVASVQKQLNTLGTITFASGSTALTSHDKTIVKKAAAILKADPTIHIQLQGDTDSVGPAAYNLTVSRLRAHTVANALHALGIATSRMAVVGYGETHPKASNSSPSGRAANRRVDLAAKAS